MSFHYKFLQLCVVVERSQIVLSPCEKVFTGQVQLISPLVSPQSPAVHADSSVKRLKSNLAMEMCILSQTALMSEHERRK